MKKLKEENQIRRAALYCRVSTTMQGEAEYSSLNAQEDKLRNYCNGRDWEIVRVYSDMKSGKDLERPEMQQLLKDAEDDIFDVVVATKIDRFSRSIVDFHNLFKILNALGIDIVASTQDNLDTTTSGGKFMLNIILAFAEFERNMISERTKEGMTARALKGFYTGGHLILGYDNVEGKLIVNETEKELVPSVFHFSSAGFSNLVKLCSFMYIYRYII